MEMERNGSRAGKGNLTGFPDDCWRAGQSMIPRFLAYTTGSMMIPFGDLKEIQA